MSCVQPGRRNGVRSRPLARTVFLTTLLAGAASADDATTDDDTGLLDWFDSAYVQVGYGFHWDDSDDYRGVPAIGGVELARDDRHRVGISLFNNSFGQFSQYYYYGYKWRLPFISESTHFKLTGGLIYGYVGEFEDRLNPSYNGWAPAIIPSLGWKKDRLGVDFALLGDAGFSVLIGYDFWTRERRHNVAD